MPAITQPGMDPPSFLPVSSLFVDSRSPSLPERVILQRLFTVPSVFPSQDHGHAAGSHDRQLVLKTKTQESKGSQRGTKGQISGFREGQMYVDSWRSCGFGARPSLGRTPALLFPVVRQQTYPLPASVSPCTRLGAVGSRRPSSGRFIGGIPMAENSAWDSAVIPKVSAEQIGD